MRESFDMTATSGSTPIIVRRQPVKLTSPWRHLFWAFALLQILAIGVWAYLSSFGDPIDAQTLGDIPIAARPMPSGFDTLNGTSTALPDLLSVDVPVGVNPTETLDALGNPVTTSNTSTGSTTSSNTPPPANSGPRTILINGQPLNATPSPLPPAPISGLSAESSFGPVPAPNSKGLTPHKAYARPFSPVSGKKPVSIVIGGLGVNAQTTQAAITSLPPEVTLAFAAHAPNLQNWINQARAAGHEVLLEIPMESADFNINEPGASRALRVSNGAADNIRNLEWMLSRAQGYFGLTNYNGDLFLTRSDINAPILNRMSEAGLGFIFDGSIDSPSLSTISGVARLPFASAFSLIDINTDAGAITSELERVRLAGINQTAPIGFGFAYPDTITAVREWVKTLDATDLVLAPASSKLP